mmetsp:Transcript_51335/g.121586  ORF Transcript_51335/g.121586 Transcript_51335/m.121586 type:complete len:223 (-) Transcript_51335:314-982(-)
MPSPPATSFRSSTRTTSSRVASPASKCSATTTAWPPSSPLALMPTRSRSSPTSRRSTRSLPTSLAPNASRSSPLRWASRSGRRAAWAAAEWRPRSRLLAWRRAAGSTWWSPAASTWATSTRCSTARTSGRCFRRQSARTSGSAGSRSPPAAKAPSPSPRRPRTSSPAGSTLPSSWPRSRLFLATLMRGLLSRSSIRRVPSLRVASAPSVRRRSRMPSRRAGR